MSDQPPTNTVLQRTDLPAMAVAICTRDRDESLLTTLESVWAQTFQPAELVVIDDGRMRDETWEQIAVACQDAGIEWKYDRSEATGTASWRNRAAWVAASEVIQYLDDRVACEPTFLERVGELFLDERVAGVAATVRDPLQQTAAGRRIEQWRRYARWWRLRPRGEPPDAAPRVLLQPDVATRVTSMAGCAMAFRRGIVRTHPFDEQIDARAPGQDRELAYRLASSHWFIESRRARVEIRRDAARIADARRVGRATAFNYLYTMNETCELRNLRRLEPFYSVATMALAHVVEFFRRRKRTCLLRSWGLIEGIGAWWRSGVRAMRHAASHEPRQGSGIEGATASGDSGAIEESATAGRLRALFIIDRLDEAGAGRLIVSLTKALPAQGVAPVVVCLAEAGPLAADCAAAGIGVHEYQLKFDSDVAVIPRLRRLARRERADVLVLSTSGGEPNSLTTIAALAARLPFVVWSRTMPRSAARGTGRLSRALARGADRFVVPSESHREALARFVGVAGRRMVVIPDGVERSRSENRGAHAKDRAAAGPDGSVLAAGGVAGFGNEVETGGAYRDATSDQAAEAFAVLMNEVIAERSDHEHARAFADATAYLQRALEDARRLDCRWAV